ncbi:hypothetical protein Semix9P1_phi37 [Clostridioides phage phiSemix9P1]|uniref:hypothetical protein n=2 Tax=Clostridioides TaxID=1870884 RepID=UPI0009C3DDEB|nr:hypothetical protein [Clostridioides sp. ES-S-0107-01]ARB07080.1 hypothetical protein Semix9P1_phi37 [Clostridioides phage phiSemix9P1]MCC0642098.1 hypothetical protein [Clostridioides sp. ES-S-0049-03]MCC0646134.1 hypothetical protein [Clostridioides sp. ZZV14-6150]MCC0654669.1 hypothetical protein [Clostridioides sp. ES-S-0001-03]MCC0678158.1 hypothetical protein [Clostridioides sp. ES-W-0018-02]MCC0697210.1 hypothetical protein [Clostridioides sp. ES-S-0048-02]MCC0704878.1 hypothetical
MVWKKMIISSMCALICSSAIAMPIFADEYKDKNIEQYSAVDYIDDTMVKMSYIKSGTCTLNISGNTARVICSIRGSSNVKSTSIIARLQKSNDNGKTWSTIQTWNASGNSSCTLSKSKTIGRGYYRVHSTIKANSESKNIVSSEKRY